MNRSVFVYIDDILIFSRSVEEHRVHVRKVLQRLLENRLYVKAEKCDFHVPSVSFLGYIIGQGQIRMHLGPHVLFHNSIMVGFIG